MPDFLFLLESRLTLEHLRVLELVQNASLEHGLNLYLVGGTLRDLIYGYPIRDLDFALEGPALKVVRTLAKKDVQVWEMNEELRSAEVLFPGRITAEISSCRSEHHARTGQEPEVVFSSIYDDLRHRDFSMNAIGLSLNPASRGLLLDPNNGVGDIERREIRVLHNYSFVDDPVRLVRAVRFRARLRFALEAKTESLFRSALERNLMEFASPSRLLKELKEIGREENPVDILKALDREGLTTVFHPRLGGSRLNLQGLARAVKTARSLENNGIPVNSYGPFTYFLLEKIPARARTDLARRLGMRRQDSEPWMRLEDESKHLVRALAGKQANTPSKAFQLLSLQPGELLLFVLMKFPQKKIQDKVKSFLHHRKRMRDHLPEKELQSLGVAADSPRYQKILQTFFLAVLDGKLKSHREQLKHLKRLAAEVK